MNSICIVLSGLLTHAQWSGVQMPLFVQQQFMHQYTNNQRQHAHYYMQQQLCLIEKYVEEQAVLEQPLMPLSRHSHLQFLQPNVQGLPVDFGSKTQDVVAILAPPPSPVCAPAASFAPLPLMAHTRAHTFH
jgi:GH43 family beta-xylosidase